MTDQSLQVAEETLAAMPERALWWERTRTLAIADLHLGKDEGLRRAGAALPRGPMEQDLERLSTAIERTSPDRVIVVGDLVHGRLGLTDRVIEAVAAWRASVDAAMVLVPGNHELSVNSKRLRAALDAWKIDTADAELTLGPISFVHDPDDASGPSVCGHVHPALRVGRQKVPAFARLGETVLLPAFSAFTAGAPIDPASCDELLLCCEDQVVRFSGSPRSPAV